MSKRPLGMIAASGLIAAAVITDILQSLVDLLVFIPAVGIILSFVLGVIIDISAMIIFGMWFSILGVSLVGRYPLGFLGTSILEIIPLLNILPGWTMFVTLIIIEERIKGRSSGGV